MTIPAKTIIGNLVGFIPGLSTIASPFKISTYSKNKAQIEKTAAVASILHRKEIYLLKKLKMVSFFQLIPGVNIIAAAIESLFLKKLADLQGKNGLHDLYKIKHIQDKRADEELRKGLALIDDMYLRASVKEGAANVLYAELSCDRGASASQKIKEYFEYCIERYEREINLLRCEKLGPNENALLGDIARRVLHLTGLTVRLKEELNKLS